MAWAKLAAVAAVLLGCVISTQALWMCDQASNPFAHGFVMFDTRCVVREEIVGNYVAWARDKDHLFAGKYQRALCCHGQYRVLGGNPQDEAVASGAAGAPPLELLQTNSRARGGDGSDGDDEEEPGPVGLGLQRSNNFRLPGNVGMADESSESDGVVDDDNSSGDEDEQPVMFQRQNAVMYGARSMEVTRFDDGGDLGLDFGMLNSAKMVDKLVCYGWNSINKADTDSIPYTCSNLGAVDGGYLSTAISGPAEEPTLKTEAKCCTYKKLPGVPGKTYDCSGTVDLTIKVPAERLDLGMDDLPAEWKKRLTGDRDAAADPKSAIFDMEPLVRPPSPGQQARWWSEEHCEVDDAGAAAMGLPRMSRQITSWSSAVSVGFGNGAQGIFGSSGSSGSSQGSDALYKLSADQFTRGGELRDEENQTTQTLKQPAECMVVADAYTGKSFKANMKPGGCNKATRLDCPDGGARQAIQTHLHMYHGRTDWKIYSFFSWAGWAKKGMHIGGLSEKDRAKKALCWHFVRDLKNLLQKPDREYCPVVEGAPIDWECAPELYSDGQCHCQCGAWDPDCSVTSNGKVLVYSNAPVPVDCPGRGFGQKCGPMGCQVTSWTNIL